MKINKAFMILALTCLALAGCGPVEPTARDVDGVPRIEYRLEKENAKGSGKAKAAGVIGGALAAGYLAGRKGHTA